MLTRQPLCRDLQAYPPFQMVPQAGEFDWLRQKEAFIMLTRISYWVTSLGARFALLEMTALLVALLPKHLFEPSLHKVVAKQVLVLRPTVYEEEVAALPLKVTNL